MMKLTTAAFTLALASTASAQVVGIQEREPLMMRSFTSSGDKGMYEEGEKPVFTMIRDNQAYVKSFTSRDVKGDKTLNMPEKSSLDSLFTFSSARKGAYTAAQDTKVDEDQNGDLKILSFTSDAARLRNEFESELVEAADGGEEGLVERARGIVTDALATQELERMRDVRTAAITTFFITFFVAIVIGLVVGAKCCSAKAVNYETQLADTERGVVVPSTPGKFATPGTEDG